MSDTIEIVAVDQLLEVHASGKLTSAFYQELMPAVERQIEHFGKLRILFVMNDFHGWTAGAMWEDLKFDWHHGKEIERLAIVGESKWQEGMASFCKPFTKAKIQYFDHAHIDAARQWVIENA